ncbi:DUF4097 and DUF4098 domain-containing protein YvlB [Arthrobacter pigmenti]|uniref:DUF4097 and DUF4098 domain-containing protein YvlB n=1 Tax=Arthrobacter pigmenti TaxID=271432 RepID=A0A846RJ58_9MICC|nr:DUF4097 family beta strand repeat-containing protein [Arthrobacter pigmenti]NJC23263.1 DUF4097 and DUF4098 domain-containing protein YvlB [Arthrobacter pigmenti]
MQYTYEASTAIDAKVTLMMGELVITADDVSEVTVTVEPTQPDRPADVRAAENTAVDFADGRLTIIQKRENLVSTWVNKSWSIDVHVRVPKRSRFEVKSSYGNIRVRGLLGRSSLTTSYGNISAGDVADLTAKTSHGEITLDRSSGTTTLTASSATIGEVYGSASLKCSQGNAVVGLVMGQLEVAGSFGNIEVRTVMGNVNARTSHGRIRLGDGVSGTAQLATSHGDIEVGIRQGTLTWLDLDTKAGAVRNELAVASDEPQNDDDDGAAERLEVTARTNHGSVRAFRAAAN